MLSASRGYWFWSRRNLTQADEGEFLFLHGERCMVQCFGDVADLQVGMLGKDVVGGHSVSDHRDGRGDREAKIANARDAAHLVR